MITENNHEICKACAIGSEKYPHNGDPKTCVKGKVEYLKQLDADEQIKQLIIHERMSIELAEHIEQLAKQRKKTPLEILQEEGFEV
jgi:hypothetical protein